MSNKNQRSTYQLKTIKMKKAKLLLTLVIALTSICSTLAYKKRGMDSVFYMPTVTGGRTYCTVPTIINSIITDSGRPTVLSTAPWYDPCPTIQITFYM